MLKRDEARWRCAACSSPRPWTRSPTILQRRGDARAPGRRAAIPGYVVAGKTGHRPEDRRLGPLLDGRPRGLVRRLRAGLAPRARGPRLARHAARAARTRAATSRRRSSRASRRARCACLAVPPDDAAPRAARGGGRRPADAHAGGLSARSARRGRSVAPPADEPGPDARPARPSGARGGDRRRAARARRGAARLGPGRRAEPRSRARRSSRASPAC